MLAAERSEFQQSTTEYKQERHRLELSLDNERQTVSFLVSEKSSLAAELNRLEGVESSESTITGTLSELTKKLGAREFEGSLIEERKKSSTLEVQVTSLRSSYEIVSGQLRHLETKERELNDKCRDQVCCNCYY